MNGYNQGDASPESSNEVLQLNPSDSHSMHTTLMPPEICANPAGQYLQPNPHYLHAGGGGGGGYIEDEYEEQPDEFDETSGFLADDPRMSHQAGLEHDLRQFETSHLMGPIMAHHNGGLGDVYGRQEGNGGHLFSEAQLAQMRSLGIKTDPTEAPERRPMVINADEMEPNSKRPTQTASEKKRRDQIKNGYEKLAQICGKNKSEGAKMSHATILNNAVDYINNMEYDIKSLKDEYKQVEMQITAVEMMKQAYSVMSNRADIGNDLSNISQSQAFGLFREMAEMLYDSFRQYVNIHSFPQLAQTMLKWTELYCSPAAIQRTCELVLDKLRPTGLTIDIPASPEVD